MWRALPRGPLHLRLCSFAGCTGSMVGCWGSRDWELEGFSVAAVLSLGDLSSRSTGAAYSFGGLLVIGHITSPCGLGLQFYFHPWGVSWVSWVMGFGAYALGTMHDGAGRFPLLYTYMCLH